MARGDKGLDNYGYDRWLGERAKRSRSARNELRQRNVDRRGAHDSEGVGWHFGLDNAPVRAESREHFREVLDKKGLMLEVDVKKELKGPRKHEFGGRTKR